MRSGHMTHVRAPALSHHLESLFVFKKCTTDNDYWTLVSAWWNITHGCFGV